MKPLIACLPPSLGIALWLLLQGAVSAQEPTESLDARRLIDATGFEGIVLIHDLRQNTSLAGHAELADERVLPASTFKIFSSLVILELGIVADRNTVVRWDGVQRSRPEINRDLTLTEAFRLSAVPHYQQMVKRIGAARMQHYIDAAGYGNGDISGGIDTFWLTGGLRISASEQIAFLQRLYRDDLPFSAEVMASVREMMVTETGSDYLVRAKTGWATPDGGDNIGWWAGWVERNDEVVFFASLLRTNKPGSTFGAARLSLARAVLQQQGVLPQD
ncbi:MAG: penicillin-binding transpeptidase domain-containing protein [Pseudomonadales bacterium]|nr:penicillin-binding transpeptidase domain-containing protein [Pseudomonadales bacterium]